MAELLTAATPISYYLVAVNIIAFILYGTDKAKAMHHQWRIKEAVLIGIAFAGGAFGAFAGMIVFHHNKKDEIPNLSSNRYYHLADPWRIFGRT